MYDIGTEAGEYFIAMEHVPGRDLRDLLDARPGEPLPLGLALHIVQVVAGGLHHAHEQRGEGGELLGVVHRDVSPANVLLGWDGAVKLSDFGVAKWAAQRSRTEQGTLKGKLGYMSPEQCRGEPLDRRSDVFALGVLLYELTTGARPFRAASDFETLSAIVAGNYPPPSSLVPGYPAALEAVIGRALRVDAGERFPDAAAIQAALAEAARELNLPTAQAALAGALADRLRSCFPDGRAVDEAEGTPAPEMVAAPAVAPPAPAAPAPRTERTMTDAASTPRRSRRLPRAAVPLVAVAMILGVVIAGYISRSQPSPQAQLGPNPSVGPAPAPAPATHATAPARSVAAATAAAPPNTAAIEPTAMRPPKGQSHGQARSPQPSAKRGTPNRPRRDVRVWDPDSPIPP